MRGVTRGGAVGLERFGCWRVVIFRKRVGCGIVGFVGGLEFERGGGRGGGFGKLERVRKFGVGLVRKFGGSLVRKRVERRRKSRIFR